MGESTQVGPAQARKRGLRNDDQLERLASWLHAELLPSWGGARFASLLRTSGGVSYETWILELEDPTDATNRARFALRREPLRGPLEPYDVIDEARVIEALAGTGVPAPEVLAVCTDESVIDRRFSVLAFVEGDVPDYRTITARPDWRDPGRRARMADEFLRVLAELQRVEPTRLPRIAAARPPRSERERLHGLIETMAEQARHRMASWVPLPIFGDAARWCKENAPDGPTSEMVVVHGDYKIGNFIYRDERIVAMLDWEGAMLGDPLQDLGYACHPAMREAEPGLMAMLAPFEEFVSRYEHFTGTEVDRRRLHYYVIYALLFHTWTLLIGVPSIVEWDGDMRMATAYSKLNQVTRMLVDQIESYERGGGVL